MNGLRVNPVSSVEVDGLTKLWADVREHIIQEGSITATSGAISSVKDLTRRLGVDIQKPAWAGSLEDIFRKASVCEQSSVRVAAAGIARSFRILGTWGELLANDPNDKEICRQVRLISGRILRGFSKNPFLKCADWLQETIITRLLRASFLPTSYREAFHNVLGKKARESDAFDAVREFSVAGIHDEVAAVETKFSEMPSKMGRWKSFLLTVENFLNDVIGPHLSGVDAVANLQARWRIIARRMDPLLRKPEEFTNEEKQCFDGYAMQLRWTQKSLTRYAKDKVWEHGDDADPFLHIKRVQEPATGNIVTLVQKRLREAGFAVPEVMVVVVERV